MPAAQWLGTLNALKNTSQDEVISLGLTDYLSSVSPETKVFKSDLCSLVQEKLEYPMRLELLTRKLSKYRPEFKIERFSQELLPKKVRKLLVHTMVLDCFKFSSFNYRIIKYRFDGGWFGSIDTCIVLDNKWEVLRPKRCYTMLEAVDMIYMLMTEKFKDFVSTCDDTEFESYSTLGVDNRYQEWLLTLPYWHDAFENSHFDVTNVLLHIRTSQWRDEQGEELLLVDELQSDWHAQGRDYGYYSTHEEPDDNRVPQVAYAKEWALLGVRVALAIAVQKGLNRLAFVSSQEQAERYGDLLDGFVQLYDKQIPDYLNKLAKRFTCGFSQASIMVSKPRYNIRYISRRTIELQPRYQSASSHYVLSYPVAMFYLKKTGNKIMRELKVFEISPALRDSIRQHGLPIFGNFKMAC